MLCYILAYQKLNSKINIKFYYFHSLRLEDKCNEIGWVIKGNWV